MNKNSICWLVGLAVLLTILSGCASKSSQPQAPTAYDFVMADVQRKADEANIETKPATIERRASARVDVAMAQYQAGGYDRAFVAAQEATSLDGKNLNAWIVLALSQEKLMVSFQDISQTYNTALQKFPGQVDLMHNYGWFMCRNSQEVGGLDLLSKAATSNQNASPSRTFLAMSKCAVKSNANAAAEYARRALDLQPQWAEAWLSLGQAQASQGMWEKSHQSILKYFENENKPSSEAIQLALKVATARNDQFHINLYTNQLNTIAPHRLK